MLLVHSCRCHHHLFDFEQDLSRARAIEASSHGSLAADPVARKSCRAVSGEVPVCPRGILPPVALGTRVFAEWRPCWRLGMADERVDSRHAHRYFAFSNAGIKFLPALKYFLQVIGHFVNGDWSDAARVSADTSGVDCVR